MAQQQFEKQVRLELKTKKENSEVNIRIKYIKSIPTIIEILESSDDERISNIDDDENVSINFIVSSRSTNSKLSPVHSSTPKKNFETSKARKSSQSSPSRLTNMINNKKSNTNKSENYSQKSNNHVSKKHLHSKNLSSQTMHHKKKH